MALTAGLIWDTIRDRVTESFPGYCPRCGLRLWPEVVENEGDDAEPEVAEDNDEGESEGVDSESTFPARSPYTIPAPRPCDRWRYR